MVSVVEISSDSEGEITSKYLCPKHGSSSHPSRCVDCLVLSSKQTIDALREEFDNDSSSSSAGTAQSVGMADEDRLSSDEDMWVDQEVLDAYSKMLTEESLMGVRHKLCYPVDEGSAEAFPATLDEAVSDDPEEGEEPFIYVYQTWFEHLGIRVPFPSFYCDVLKMINAAPSQLHPNAWAHMRAFEILCECLEMEATATKFLYFFRTTVKKPCRWISLKNNKCLLSPFASSYKDFKNMWFRLRAGPKCPHLLVDESGEPRFPLYWTPDPQHKFSVEKRELSAGERAEVTLLDEYQDNFPSLPKASRLLGLVDDAQSLIDYLSNVRLFFF